MEILSELKLSPKDKKVIESFLDKSPAGLELETNKDIISLIKKINSSLDMLKKSQKERNVPSRSKINELQSRVDEIFDSLRIVIYDIEEEFYDL